MKIINHQKIDVIPNAQGQRPFPTNEITGFDPFIMLDHIGPSTMPENWRLDGGSDEHPNLHPHRGFETITFMFQGNLHHRDSVFKERPLLTNGSVQRMNAGSGIRHGGDMWPDEQQQFHEIQLWVNIPAKDKMSSPSISNVKNKDIPVVTQGDAELRVIAGCLDSIKGPINTYADIRVIHGVVIGKQNIILKQAQLNHQHDKTMLYMLTGSAIIKGEKINTYQAAAFDDVLTHLEFTVSNGEFFLVSGKSINEPVAFDGPFVMNTKEEIEAAKRDYTAGVF